MKLIYCNNCREVLSLSRTTKTCQCGESGGHYKTDKLNAIIHGNCKPLGFTNNTFSDALENQPEYGNGREFTSFVIPVVCPTITHVDSEDYESSGRVDYDEVYDEMMVKAEVEKYKKKIKIKNVFKDEE